MEKEIKFRLDRGAKMPTYKNQGASGICVSANSILKIYNNGSEVAPEILKKAKQGFQDRGYIKIRVNERIVFGTGLYAEVPEGFELQVTALTGLYTEKGVHTINQLGSISAGSKEEIEIILVSSTTFQPIIKKGTMLATSASYLPKIEKGEEIAQLIVKEVLKPVISRIIEDSEDLDIEGAPFM